VTSPPAASENPAKLAPGDSPSEKPSLLYRLHQALGPLAGALILDVVDFTTFGPIGIVLGLVVGVPIGWWISSIYGFSPLSRALFATLAGLYCTVPFTEVLPLATLISASARFWRTN
jgi:hypothetical protein